MKTDHALAELFAEDPDLIKLFVPAPADCHYTMKAEVVKEVERRIDACFIPDDPDVPIQVVEFLGYQDANATYRLVSGGCLIGMRNPGRVVHYLLVLLDASLDPKTEPWHSYALSGLLGFRVVTLAEVLSELRQSQPDHPLVVLLSVLIETDPDKVKETIPKGYQQIRDAGLPEGLRETYVKIYVYWLTLRLSMFSKQEVIEMLQIATSFEETRFYKDMKEEFDAVAEEKIRAKLTQQLEMLKRLRAKGNLSEAEFREEADPVEAELRALQDQKKKSDRNT